MRFGFRLLDRDKGVILKKGTASTPVVMDAITFLLPKSIEAAALFLINPKLTAL